jgi:hypothetical protein
MEVWRGSIDVTHFLGLSIATSPYELVKIGHMDFSSMQRLRSLEDHHCQLPTSRSLLSLASEY